MLEGPVSLLVITGDTGSKFVPKFRDKFGAGDENRTHVSSLEGCRSTIELHPLVGREGFEPSKA